MQTQTTRAAHHLGGPAAPKRDWFTTAKACRILDRLTAADVNLYAATPLMGERHYAWSAGEAHDDLIAIRTAEIEAQFGLTFSEACDAGQSEQFFNFYNSVPTVDDVLAEKFGSPSRFGRPPLRVIDGPGDGPARWAQERDALSAQVAA